MVTSDVGGEVGRWDFDGESGALVATFLVEVAFVHDDGVVVVIDGDRGSVWKALCIIIHC
jgi:hypothetical protein